MVGTISETSLIPLASELNDQGSEGTATYHVKTVGETGTAKGIVTSIKADGKWSVNKAHLILDNKDRVVLKE